MENSRAIDRYLQAILILSRKYYCVRSVDVAHYMGCSKAAVSVALKQLAAEKLVSAGIDGALSLTVAGKERARQLHQRCLFFQDLLCQAGVDGPLAEQEAAAMEHAVSSASCEALRQYLAAHGIRTAENIGDDL